MGDEQAVPLDGQEHQRCPVTLPTAFDISCVARVRSEVIDGLERGQRLLVDGGAVERADTAAIQLLWAIHRHATERQAPVIWRLNDTVRDTARRLGLAGVIAVLDHEGGSQ